MVYVKPIYQAIDTTTITNGAYWMNGNFDNFNTSSIISFMAKQDSVVSLINNSSNTTGDTYSV